MQPIAIVHGIEIEDRNFAETPKKLLTEAFAAAVGPDGPDPEAALVVEPLPLLKTQYACLTWVCS